SCSRTPCSTLLLVDREQQVESLAHVELGGRTGLVVLVPGLGTLPPADREHGAGDAARVLPAQELLVEVSQPEPCRGRRRRRYPVPRGRSGPGTGEADLVEVGGPIGGYVGRLRAVERGPECIDDLGVPLDGHADDLAALRDQAHAEAQPQLEREPLALVVGIVLSAERGLVSVIAPRVHG